MQIPVSEARGQLTELARRAEAGDEVVLTRHGKATVKLVPMRPNLDAGARPAITAARSQDFLNEENGLPG